NSSHYQTLSRPVEFNGKKWVLLFARHNNPIPLFQSRAIIVLIGGALLSLLLFLLSISLINTRRRALQIAKQLTVELKENAEKYKNLSNLFESIIDHVPGLLFYKDKKNNYIRINKYIAHAHGKQKSEIEGKNLSELYSKEDAEKYYQDDLKVINSGVPKLNIEEEWTTEDGLKWINTSKIPFVNDAGEIIGIIGISIDITERVKAERQLRESEEKFSATFHASPYLISITRISDGTILEVNEGYTNLLGYSRDESIGKNTSGLSIWVDPADRATFIASLEKYGEINNFETRLKCKDGTIITVIDSAKTINFQGEPCTLSIVHDITDRKRAEDIILNAGLYNRSLIEASIDPLVTIGPDRNITDVNKATEDATGLLREQLIGSDFSNYVTEPEQANKAYKQVLEKGFIKNYPLTIRHADGKTTDVLYNATVYKNQQGEVVGVFAAARDITESKRTEEVIRNANLYNRSLIEASIDPLVTIGPDGKITDVNKATENVTGLLRKQLIGSDFSDYFTEPQLAETGYKKVLADGFVKDYPLTIRHADGKTTDVLYNATVYKNQKGEIIGVFAAARDITESKRSQEIIRNANLYNRSLIEASIDPLVTIGPDGKITDVNKATEDVTGMPRVQLIGSDFSNYFTQSQQANIGYKQVLEKGSVKDYPLTIRRTDGKTTDVLYNATVYKNADGKIVGVFAAARDITERKKNEEALIKSESNLRAIFENTSKGFLLMDNTFTVIEFNSLMEKYIAISDNIILRKNENIFNNIPPERQEFLRTQFNTALDGEKVHYEISYSFSGNTTIYFEVKMYPVLDPEERVAGICISYEDITTRKLTEEQIIELNKDLDKKVQERTMQYELVNQELESFTFSVSHDLRAPLRAVNSYAQILEEDYSDKLDEDGKKMLKHIENNGKKMGRLIDDLLAFSRLGRKELKRVDVNMNDLTKAVVDELNQTFPNQATIEIADLPIVQGDYSLLYQAMLNLVSNAIKYSSKKDKPVIKIFTEQKDGKTIFTIKDNGAGFDMRFAEKLFGVFQRLHSEEEFEGSGIGLAIVHRIIAKHGGEVWGEGKVNEGATFHFKLN
ncbi:MAG: PAS domain S-box protein, partial [Bacteroidota bacterium]|nr:PAS domain S-box protein [Bacteroidota bacterium]